MTMRDRRDRYGPMEWAQQGNKYTIILHALSVTNHICIHLLADRNYDTFATSNESNAFH